MNLQETAPTPAEARELLLAELFSVLRPSFYVGLFMGIAFGWLSLEKVGLIRAVGTAVLMIPLATALGFFFGWCYREGARSLSRTPRIVFGPIWVLALQSFVNFCFNLVIGLVKGPFTFIKVLIYLRRLQRL